MLYLSSDYEDAIYPAGFRIRGIDQHYSVFGPFIGAIPSVIIIALADPIKGIYFLIFIFILQQVDGNIIGPKILGDSTGLNSFWVVFAIMVGGGLFGIGGMILGVPTFAVIYYIIDKTVDYCLRKRKLPEDTDEYIRLEKVDEKTNEIVLLEEPVEEASEKKELHIPSIKKKEKK